MKIRFYNRMINRSAIRGAAFIFAAALILTAAVICSSCAEKEIILDLDEVFGRLDEMGYLDGLYELDASRILMEYGIKEDMAAQIRVLNSENIASADEVFMCEAADAQSKEAIVNKLKDRRVKKQLDMTEYFLNPNYAQEYLNVTDSRIIDSGMYVFYVISGDAGALNGVIEQLIKEAPRK